MKNPLLSLAFCLTALTISVSSDAADESVSVMSFNIRYGTAKDGENAWPHRRAFVVETIQQRKPDLLGLQEAIDLQVEYLAKRLPDYTKKCPSRASMPPAPWNTSGTGCFASSLRFAAS